MATIEIFQCGHESTDKGASLHLITHNGRLYQLCNECGSSFDWDNPPGQPVTEPPTEEDQ